MKSLKYTFTIPEDLVLRMKNVVEQRKRSAFIASAIAEKLATLEQEQRNHLLIEGYIARQQEDVEMNNEWAGPTIEEWR